jgi:putative transposase
MTNTLPVRSRPARQPVHDAGNLSPIIFLTVCAKDRKMIFACADVHERMREAWQQADHWRVGFYLLMPDHIHLFCSPARHPPSPLNKWITYWKSLASRKWPRPVEHPVWQQ